MTKDLDNKKEASRKKSLGELGELFALMQTPLPA